MEGWKLGFLGWVYLILILFSGWIILGYINQQLIPTPSETFFFIYHYSLKTIFLSILKTLFNSVSGFIVALLLSFTSIIAWFINHHLKSFIESLNTFIQSVSVLVWSLVFLLVFGVTSIAPPILVVASASYPILLNGFIGATKNLDKKYGELSEMLGASRLQELYHFILPGTLPYLASASRSALGLALRISVVAEAFGASGGVGYQLAYSFDMGLKEGVFAWALILIGLMILLDYIILRPMEGWSRKWML